MTMKAEIEPGDLTAKEIVNGWTEKDLADTIWKYGEERFSRKIAKISSEGEKLRRLKRHWSWLMR